jgi:hypothetical protein
MCSQAANRDELESLLAFLDSCALFEGVPEADRLRVAQNLIRKEYKSNRGETVCL